MTNKIKAAANAALQALRARLASVDPKLLTTTVSTVVTGAIVRLGFDSTDPIVVLLAGVVVGAIVGYVTKNAASGLADRWTPALPPETANAEDGPPIVSNEDAPSTVPLEVDEDRMARHESALALSGVDLGRLE